MAIKYHCVRFLFYIYCIGVCLFVDTVLNGNSNKIENWHIASWTWDEIPKMPSSLCRTFYRLRTAKWATSYSNTPFPFNDVWCCFSFGGDDGQCGFFAMIFIVLLLSVFGMQIKNILLSVCQPYRCLKYTPARTHTNKSESIHLWKLC